MASLHLNNFLWAMRNIVMGGGVGKDGVTARDDGGYLHDMNFSLGDILPADSGGSAVSPLLGSAGNFQVLAGAGITNSGPTTIQGNVGVGPGSPTATGFPPGVILGTLDAGAGATAGQTALTAAVAVLNGQSSYTTISTTLGGQTLTPGNYTAGASTLTGTLTLNGAGVYILKLGSITISNAAAIVLTGGATANNVYFTSTGTTTVGTTASLYGNFINATSMTFNTGATLQGRAFAQSGSVTFLTNVLSFAVAGTGTGSSSAPASAFKSTYIIPIPTNVDFVNSAQWDLALPFNGTLNSIGYRVGKPVTTGAKAATLTASVNDVAVTGGVVSLTSATMTPTGAFVAGTTITAGNTFTAGQAIGFAVSAVTTFVEGDGYIELVATNTDAQTASATTSNIVVSSETNLRVASFAAGTTAAGTISLVIPRDYDEATDTFQLKIGVASAGATDAPAITATAYRKRPGASIVTVASTVSGKTEAGGTFTMTSADQIMVFNFSRNGLRRDDAITIVLTSGAHATDALLYYFVEPVYRSTLVSYHESNVNPNTATTRDGKTGTFLR